MSKKIKTELQALKEVRKLIAHGWTKGTFRRKVFGRDCYCLSGAVNIVTRGCPGIRHRVTSALWNALPLTIRSIVGFNDRKSTTKKDVLDVIDRAIAEAS